jgi:replicative DNA helicase
VDHLQRMARDPKAQGDDWLSVGQNAIALKSLAMRMRVPVLAACQLSAEAEDKRPSMAHLARARGIISQEADVIGFLWPDGKQWDDRSQPRPSVRLLLDKQRGGPTGEIALTFERALTRFYGVADDTADWRTAGA